MTENRYRAKSPPRSRGYHDPRSSAGAFYSSSFDPGYGSQPRSAIEPYQSSRHSSIYDTRPIKQYSYKDDAHPGSTVSRTEYAVRPRTNSNVPSDGRRPVSMIVRNTSPTRRPVVSNSSRDDALASRPAPYVLREEPPRYLVPASTQSQGREHHQRHFSATRADGDRLNVGSRAGGRPMGEYHHAGGYGQKSYSSNRPSVKDDDYSYTGPREQFDRDMQARAPPARESYSRRDRPLSVVEIPDSKPPAPVRREMGPPPIPRQLERLDRPEDRRSSTRPIYEDERAGEVPSRRHSVRAPVVHQLRDSGYASRDDVDIRPKPRRDRIQEEEPLPKLRTRDLERERDYPRDLERDRDTRDHDRERDREREPDRDRDRDREKDWERPRGHEKLKHADDRREPRSRDNSPERSGVAKGIATGLGGAAIAGLAGAALKGSSKPDDASDSDGRRERRHRKHKHRDRGDEESGPREEASERKPAAPVDDRGPDERSRSFPKPDESASESYEDEHQRRRHRRRKHKDRDDADAGNVLDPRSAAADPPRSDRELAEPEDDGRHRRRPERPSSRTREPEVPESERRTVPPGEDEDDRPRRVLLVEPEKKEEFKPRGILKAPRRVPFPEDPNPTREGVAPLKDAGKDGVPNGARWTKISRVLVNPEALEKAQERFEERDDYVIVLRVVTREEIQKFAEKTREIREEREKQWQEELVEKQKHKDSEHRPHHEGGSRRPRDIVDLSSDEDADKVAQPLLDQRPAMPGVDPRSLIKPAMAPVALGGLPVPDIILDTHDMESANYSTNV